MRCPFCHEPENKVIDSRESHEGAVIRRRRECEKCAHRFTTYERVEEPRLEVLKRRGGGRERFDRQKLLRGLARAAGGRPVSTDQLEMVADWIVAEARRGGPEVEASRIGDLAERGLARVDPVSAIQFASVYRNLRDLDELAAVVERFRDDPLPGEDQLAIDGGVPSEPRSYIGRSRKISSSKRRGHVPQP